MEMFAGTSGYDFDGWKGHFYPEDLPRDRRLAHYAAHLPTVEINYSFYRMPSAGTLQAWAEHVPESFRFVMKASQRITHRGRLADAPSTAFFAERVSLLGPRLGPVLVQLPPFFRKDAERLRIFLSSLPAHVRPAVEFRHKSWFDDEVRSILAEAKAALCLADDGELDCPEWATAEFGYLRLRRENYDDAALRDWAAKVRAMPWTRCFAFFKHEEAAVGVRLAKRWMELAAGA
ncbi:MAG: DUF72 domain-containing protein [Deltaproteobacteria bacterium]|nr:DUF72 domain-containing protein [Deltaproteobacteria bacterium]